MKTSELEMLDDIRWLLSIASVIVEHRVDHKKIRELKEKYR
jgi:hypothetical protein